MSLRGLILGLPTLAGQGAAAPSAPPYLTFDSATIGQGVTATANAGSNLGAGAYVWRWYADDVLVESLNGESEYTFTLDDVNMAWKVGAYYAATDTELFSEPFVLPFLGGTFSAFNNRSTTPTMPWATCPTDPLDGSVSYDVLVYYDGVYVSMTDDANLGIDPGDATQYTIAPALTAYPAGSYSRILATHYGSEVVYSSPEMFVPAPTIVYDEMSVDDATIIGNIADDGVSEITGTLAGGSTGQKLDGKLTLSSLAETDNLYYDVAIARAAGVMVFGEFIPENAAAAKGFRANLTSAATGGNNQAGLSSTQAACLIQAKEQSIADCAVIDGTAGVRYPFCLALRAVGYDLLIRDPDTYQWLYYRHFKTGNAASLYLRMLASAGIAGSLDNFVVPDDVHWLPTPVASDGFSDETEPITTDGLGHIVASGLNEGGSGLSWTSVLGTWQNSGGKRNATSLDGSGYALCTLDINKPDWCAYVSVVLTDTSKVVQLGGYVDADNYFYMELLYDGSNYKLTVVEVVGGTPNTLAAAANTPVSYTMVSTARWMTLWKDGTTLWKSWGNREAPAGGTFVTLNAVFENCDVVMLRTSDTTSTFDEFFAYAVGRSDEYAILERYRAALSTPVPVTLPAPADSSPLSMPTNPSGFDLIAELAAATPGGTVTLPANGVYTVPNAIFEDIIFEDVTLTVAEGVDRAFITLEDFTPPRVEIRSGTVIDTDKIWIGGEQFGNTNIVSFGTDGDIDVRCIFWGYASIQPGANKTGINFYNGGSIRCGDNAAAGGGGGGGHGIYKAAQDNWDTLEHADINIQGWLFLLTANAGLRIGHAAAYMLVKGNVYGRNYWSVAASDSAYIEFTDNVLMDAIYQDGYGGDGLQFKRNWLLPGHQTTSVKTGTPSPEVSDNKFWQVQTLVEDTNPTIVTAADVETEFGYTPDQYALCLDILEAKTATINQAMIEDRTLDHYIAIMRTLSTPYVAP